MRPKVIVNIGMPASGKNFGRTYAAEHDIVFFSTGDVVRSICKDRGLEPNSVNCTAISQELKAIGPSELTVRVRQKALDTGAEVVILEGMRSVPEIDLLREVFDVTVIAIVVGRGERLNRLMGRGRTDDDPSKFNTRDERELDYGVGDAIALADMYLHNAGTEEEGLTRYAALVEQVLGSR